ncbi:hypothetical protein GCM10022420_011710 [Streptomyces iranensis]
MTNDDTHTGTVRAPGATLHYQLRGHGPTLLIGQSGEGDADRTVDLVAHLADTHTVITYDRRGLSRSRLDDPSRGATPAEHADDAALLLATVASEPAAMLGCSLGARHRPAPRGAAPGPDPHADRPRARRTPAAARRRTGSP